MFPVGDEVSKTSWRGSTPRRPVAKILRRCAAWRRLSTPKSFANETTMSVYMERQAVAYLRVTPDDPEFSASNQQTAVGVYADRRGMVLRPRTWSTIRLRTPKSFSRNTTEN